MAQEGARQCVCFGADIIFIQERLLRREAAHAHSGGSCQVDLQSEWRNNLGCCSGQESDSMDRDAAEPPVVAAYQKKYKLWTEIHVTKVVENAFGGTLVTVRAITGRKIKHSALCFIDDNGHVSIYDSSEELARDLETRVRLGWIYRLFSRPILSGIVFAFLLVAIFIIGLRPKDSFRPEAFTALAGVLGTAAGFFFGSPQKK